MPFWRDMISGKDIIILSGIEWDTLWQGSQEIATRLAQAGNRVLYVENIGIRAPTWKDKKRIALRVKSWTGSLSTHGMRQIGNNLYVYSPIVLPPFGGHWQQHLNRRVLLPLISRVARSLGMHDAILWTFLPTDTALDLINSFNARSSSTIIYHCTADFSELTPGVLQLRESERTLLKLSDLVFASCRQLLEHCRKWNDNVHLFPNGVSFEMFYQGNGHLNGSGVSNLSSMPRPIVGYVGGLHRFVDFNLLIAMARLKPEWSWVFVGPIQTSIGELAQLPNVRLLGQQPHERLGHYLRNFDVCIVPYLKSSATATIVPTKVNEYLAAGKPVVSTELPTICDFNEQYRVLMTAPSSPDCFLRAIGESLRMPTDSETVARRTGVAKLNDWQIHLEKMSSLIQAAAKKR